MKVYIIAAMTADGFIARNSNELIDWTSSEDKKFFREMTKKSGVLIMGGNTYRTFKEPLPGRRNIVYSHQNIEQPEVETTRESPAQLVQRLKIEGASQVAIAGGSSIYTMFLKAGVVTDIYLTLEPLMFGKGIKLLQEDVNTKLTLNGVSKFNENTVLLHYKVIK
ncbi:dihydrofolate reductase family protein [Candidatus Parcubacteria bacterium]|nr:dihydrofolate reductase family protein [Candidatus Parcubacteria bacterium]